MTWARQQQLKKPHSPRSSWHRSALDLEEARDARTDGDGADAYGGY